jgi:hypothetical protein
MKKSIAERVKRKARNRRLKRYRKTIAGWTLAAAAAIGAGILYRQRRAAV